MPIIATAVNRQNVIRCFALDIVFPPVFESILVRSIHDCRESYCRCKGNQGQYTINERQKTQGGCFDAKYPFPCDAGFRAAILAPDNGPRTAEERRAKGDRLDNER